MSAQPQGQLLSERSKRWKDQYHYQLQPSCCRTLEYPELYARKPNLMQVDWITWSVFGIGLIMLVYWCIQTIRELRDLLQKRVKRNNK